MNLNGIVMGAIATVNPIQPAVLMMSTGSTTNPDGSRTPTYQTFAAIPAQVQALTYTDIIKLAGLNIQGVRHAIYLNGNWQGLDRKDRKGGDLILIAGQTWLVAVVLENWPDWTKVAATLQTDA